MSGPPLARTGTDRLVHRRGDQQWLDAAWSRARIVVINSAGHVLCREDEPGQPALVHRTAAEAPAGQRLFLGVDADETPYFAVVGDLPEVSGAREVSLRGVGAELSDLDAGLFVTAAALANWHAVHGYSPATGLPTEASDGGWLRVDAAGGHIFPRTDPAIIVLLHDGVEGPGGRCLLGNNASWPVREGRRFFSTLAGFVEPGESAEAALAREVYEEVGVQVATPRYVASQAWPFPGSLMLGFTAYVDPAQPVRPDPAEIADARWFTRSEIGHLLAEKSRPHGTTYGVARPGEWLMLPGPASIAHYLIRTWLAGEPGQR